MVKGTQSGSGITIGISPVSLPKYLKKQQIVTRSGDNELHLAEYDRWAGKIEEDIGRVIAVNLSRLLGTNMVFSYPAMEAIVPDYEIKIDITRFDGRLGGEVDFAASWAVFDREGNDMNGIRATALSEPVRGKDYDHLVAAQSRVLAAFSRELATVINKLTGD